MKPFKPADLVGVKKSESLKKISSSTSPHKKSTEPLSSLLRSVETNLPSQQQISTSMVLDSKDFNDQQEPHKGNEEQKDSLTFQRFFKPAQEKKFVKQGKTSELLKTASLQQKKRVSIKDTPLQTPSTLGLQCPFKDMKGSWLVSKKPAKTGGETLLDRIGAERLANIVKVFMGRVVKHPLLSEFFKNKHVEKISDGLMTFFKKLLSLHIPSLEAQAVSLQNTHKDFVITNEAFDIFKGYFALTFREFEVEEETTAEFLQFMEKGRKHVVMAKSAFEKAEEIFKDKVALSDKIIGKIMSNSLLNRFFEGWDQAQHRKHLGHVFDSMGEDHNLSELYIREAHKKLGISSEVFYHFKQVIGYSLKEFNVPDALVFEILSVFEDSRASIMNSKVYFDNLGEKTDINTVVKRFAGQVQANKVLSEAFKNYPSDKLLKHCRIMLEFCLKGPTNYSGCDITPAHLNLKITNQHYFAMREAFELTLLESKLQEQDIIYILADLDYYKYDICNEKCLLDRIGGEKNIEHIVNSFYLKAFQNERLCSFFKNTDPILMIRNQKFFFTRFFKAKTVKSCHFKDLRTFHLNMELKEEHFKFFVECLADILKELNIDNLQLQKEVIEWLGRTKNDVLNKKYEEK